MIDWLPGWTRVDLGPDGGPYDETGHPKACVHTTEGGSLGGAESAYAAYPPHLGYDPRYRTKHQYVRLDRHSYAFRGAESDDECIIQVEIVGRAAETHTWPDEWYRNIGEDVIAPLRQYMGIPDQHLRFYRADEGIVLARATSPIRLSDTQFRAYSGWLGHQHIPAPDEHWDPGGFLMDKALAYSREDDDMAALDEPIKVFGQDRDTTLRTEVSYNAYNFGTLINGQKQLAELVAAKNGITAEQVAQALVPLILPTIVDHIDRLDDAELDDIARVVADESDRRARERANTEV